MSNSPDQDRPQTSEKDGLSVRGHATGRHWTQAVITDPTLDNRDNPFFASVQMTRMPMILADPRQHDCPIAFANNAFLELTGYEASEVIGRNCRFLQGADTDQNAVSQLRTAISKREPIALEILNYRRDGSPFWNGVFLGPVYDEHGDLIYFFASQLDVSKRRESEGALLQAQKMEAIGQLTAGLAHDFNNLLHILLSCLGRLKQKRFDDRGFDRYLDAATKAAERGAKLTSQLLTFARRTRLEPQAVNISDLIHSFSELLETSVGEHTELHLSLQRRLPLVQIDVNHLEMALLNIVVNARDAMPSGGTIRITTGLIHLNGNAAARHLKSGDYLTIEVTDNGQGMPAHIVARATEPFFTTKPQGKGTGLGLAMVQGFVQQSGGRLEIESSEGIGTTMRLIFPKYVENNETAEATDAKPTGYITKPLDEAQTAPRILVVDDSREIAELAADTLTEVGYRVDIAFDATQAFQLYNEAVNTPHPFDLLFSDVIMPGSDNGIVLAEKILRLTPAIPVLLTTGYNDEMSLKAPGRSKFEVLGKPYNQSEMVDRVQAALKHGGRTQPERQRSDFGHAES